MVELFIFIEILSRGLYNPFYTNVSFLYPLKMSENPWFSAIFRAGCPHSHGNNGNHGNAKLSKQSGKVMGFFSLKSHGKLMGFS